MKFYFYFIIYTSYKGKYFYLKTADLSRETYQDYFVYVCAWVGQGWFTINLLVYQPFPNNIQGQECRKSCDFIETSRTCSNVHTQFEIIKSLGGKIPR